MIQLTERTEKWWVAWQFWATFEALQTNKKILQLLNIQRKIDNFPPIIASANFFPQAKLQSTQRELAFRLKTNQVVIDYLNMAQRMKVDEL